MKKSYFIHLTKDLVDEVSKLVVSKAKLFHAPACMVHKHYRAGGAVHHLLPAHGIEKNERQRS